MSFEHGQRVLETLQHGATRVVVRETPLYRELVFVRGRREQSQTRVAPRSLRSGWPCVDGFHLAALAAGDVRRVLFVGCGGGLAPLQFRRAYPSAEIDVVDVSAVVVALACRWFGLVVDGRLRVYIDDGRAFLRSRAAETYDIVVSDVWTVGSIPVPFVSEEYWHECRRVLRAGGCLAANLGGTLSDRDDPVHRIAAGAARAFGKDSVRLVAVPDPGELPTDLRLDLRRNALLLAQAADELAPRGELRSRTTSVDLAWLVHLSRIADSPALAASGDIWPFHDDDVCNTVQVV
jgi:SAM-dependent methyltransferase